MKRATSSWKLWALVVGIMVIGAMALGLSGGGQHYPRGIVGLYEPGQSIYLDNNYSVFGKDTGGTSRAMLTMTTSDNTRLNTGPGKDIIFTVGGAEMMRLTSVGNLVLNNNYSVYGKDTFGTARAMLTLTNSDNTRLNTGPGKDIIFAVGGVEKMRIDDSGRVGIGGSDTSAKLYGETVDGIAVLGKHTNSANKGGLGCYNAGAYGLGSDSSSSGVFGNNTVTDGVGVYGQATSGKGVSGWTTTGDGIYGHSAGSGYAVHGNSQNGPAVYGYSGTNTAVNGGSGSGIGVYGSTGNPGSYAGYFYGNVHVQGTLSKTAGTFKIDHPQDPANKYLSHSFVESPDMKNVYDGTIILNDKGEALIVMPSYFESLNRDFRYQLTCIGGYAPIYVADELSNNQFKIAGGKAGLKVSWQVTGIRKDAYANAHPIQVEQEKPANEKGLYLHPKELGQPEDKGINQPPVSSLKLVSD